MRYSIPITAGTTAVVRFQGKCVAIMDVGATSGLQMTLYTDRSGQDRDYLGDVNSAFSVFSDDAQFYGAEFTATVGGNIEIVVANYRVNPLDGSTMTVTLGPGSVPMQVREDVASAMTDNAAIACGAVAVALLAASAGRKAARFYNIGPDPVTLGTAGHTWAKRCLVLNAGDAHFEEHAANLAWVGITDAGAAASVTVQEIAA